MMNPTSPSRGSHPSPNQANSNKSIRKHEVDVPRSKDSLFGESDDEEPGLFCEENLDYEDNTAGDEVQEPTRPQSRPRPTSTTGGASRVIQDLQAGRIEKAKEIKLRHQIMVEKERWLTLSMTKEEYVNVGITTERPDIGTQVYGCYDEVSQKVTYYIKAGRDYESTGRLPITRDNITMAPHLEPLLSKFTTTNARDQGFKNVLRCYIRDSQWPMNRKREIPVKVRNEIEIDRLRSAAKECCLKLWIEDSERFDASKMSRYMVEKKKNEAISKVSSTAARPGPSNVTEMEKDGWARYSENNPEKAAELSGGWKNHGHSENRISLAPVKKRGAGTNEEAQQQNRPKQGLERIIHIIEQRLVVSVTSAVRKRVQTQISTLWDQALEARDLGSSKAESATKRPLDFDHPNAAAVSRKRQKTGRQSFKTSSQELETETSPQPGALCKITDIVKHYLKVNMNPEVSKKIHNEIVSLWDWAQKHGGMASRRNVKDSGNQADSARRGIAASNREKMPAFKKEKEQTSNKEKEPATNTGKETASNKEPTPLYKKRVTMSDDRFIYQDKPGPFKNGRLHLSNEGPVIKEVHGIRFREGAFLYNRRDFGNFTPPWHARILETSQMDIQGVEHTYVRFRWPEDADIGKISANVGEMVEMNRFSYLVNSNWRRQ